MPTTSTLDDTAARAHIPLEGCEVSAVEEKGEPHCLHLVVASQLAASVKGLHGRYVLECDSEAVQVRSRRQPSPASQQLDRPDSRSHALGAL
jgi:hypothetical protein